MEPPTTVFPPAAGLPKRSFDVVFLGCLGLCFTLACWVVRDLNWPGDFDLYRDMGSALAILDGNFAKDHAYLGEARWYPPLLPTLMAGLHKLTGVPVPVLFARSGPFLNVFGPIFLYLFARRVLGSQVALAATIAMFVMGSRDAEFYQRAGYSPWGLPAVVGQGAVFGVLLCVPRTDSLACSLPRALLLGLLLGLTCQLHPAPAALLGAIFTLLWLQELIERRSGAVAAGRLLAIGGIAALVSASFWLPLLIRYRGHVLNDEPGRFEGVPLRMLASEMVGIQTPFVVLGIFWCFRAGKSWLKAPAQRLLRAFLLTACVSYGYSLVSMLAYRAGIKLPQPVSGWHFYLYFKHAEALLMGMGIVLAVTWFTQRRNRAGLHTARVILGCLALLFLGHGWNHLNRREHVIYRREAFERRDLPCTLPMHKWLRANARPEEAVLAATWLSLFIYSAGRPVVQLPTIYANPYVDPVERQKRGDRMIEAIEAGDIRAFDARADKSIRYVATERFNPRMLAPNGGFEQMFRCGDVVFARRLALGGTASD